MGSLIWEINSLIVLQFGSMLISIRMATPISVNQIPWYKYCIFMIKNNNHNKALRLESNTDTLSSPKMDSILNDFDGFEYFADYLVNRLSVENILYLLEWKQLQIDLINNNLLEAIDVWNLEINKEIIDNVCCEHNGIDEIYNYM